VTRAYLHLFALSSPPTRLLPIRKRPDLWDLACDLAVETIIDDWDLPETDCPGKAARRALAGELKQQARALTADRLYHFFLTGSLSETRLAEARLLAERDDHSLWAGRPKRPESGPPGDSLSSGLPEADGNTGPEPLSATALRDQWAEMSERLQVDLQTFSRQWGDRSGSLTAAIEQAVRSHADYRAFLERFMASGEAMLLNDAEFDPVFYTYGLTLYRNLPLIEPLESREVRRIRDLVIALDTSGSTSGRLVQAFVRQTGAILSQNESFFRPLMSTSFSAMPIQSVVHLTRAEDFARYTAG
jgi:hypothetical protein